MPDQPRDYSIEYQKRNEAAQRGSYESLDDLRNWLRATRDALPDPDDWSNQQVRYLTDYNHSYVEGTKDPQQIRDELEDEFGPLTDDEFYAILHMLSPRSE